MKVKPIVSLLSYKESISKTKNSETNPQAKASTEPNAAVRVSTLSTENPKTSESEVSPRARQIAAEVKAGIYKQPSSEELARKLLLDLF